MVILTSVYWRLVESLVDQMIMRLENVFKDDKLVYIWTDENDSIEKISEKADVKAFRKIKLGARKKVEIPRRLRSSTSLLSSFWLR